MDKVKLDLIEKTIGILRNNGYDINKLHLPLIRADKDIRFGEVDGVPILASSYIKIDTDDQGIFMIVYVYIGDDYYYAEPIFYNSVLDNQDEIIELINNATHYCVRRLMENLFDNLKIE